MAEAKPAAPIISRFHLNVDDRTYWSLLLKAGTKGAEIEEKISAKRGVPAHHFRLFALRDVGHTRLYRPLTADMDVHKLAKEFEGKIAFIVRDKKGLGYGFIEAAQPEEGVTRVQGSDYSGDADAGGDEEYSDNSDDAKLPPRFSIKPVEQLLREKSNSNIVNSGVAKEETAEDEESANLSSSSSSSSCSRSQYDEESDTSSVDDESSIVDESKDHHSHSTGDSVSHNELDEEKRALYNPFVGADLDEYVFNPFKRHRHRRKHKRSKDKDGDQKQRHKHHRHAGEGERREQDGKKEHKVDVSVRSVEHADKDDPSVTVTLHRGQSVDEVLAQVQAQLDEKAEHLRATEIVIVRLNQQGEVVAQLGNLRESTLRPYRTYRKLELEMGAGRFELLYKYELKSDIPVIIERLSSSEEEGIEQSGASPSGSSDTPTSARKVTREDIERELALKERDSKSNGEALPARQGEDGVVDDVDKTVRTVAAKHKRLVATLANNYVPPVVIIVRTDSEWKNTPTPRENDYELHKVKIVKRKELKLDAPFTSTEAAVSGGDSLILAALGVKPEPVQVVSKKKSEKEKTNGQDEPERITSYQPKRGKRTQQPRPLNASLTAKESRDAIISRLRKEWKMDVEWKTYDASEVDVVLREKPAFLLSPREREAKEAGEPVMVKVSSPRGKKWS